MIYISMGHRDCDGLSTERGGPLLTQAWIHYAYLPLSFGYELAKWSMIDVIFGIFSSSCHYIFMLSANMLKFSCYLMLRKGKSNKLKFKLYDGCTVWGVRLLKIFDWMIHKCSIGSWADTAAAVLPKQGKGNSQKTFYQTFLQHDAPDCMYFAIII